MMIGMNGYLGMIYLTWSWSHELEDSSQWHAMRELWRRTAECEAEDAFRSAVLKPVMCWWNDDLYLSIQLPDGKPSVWEKWLQQLAHDAGQKIADSYLSAARSAFGSAAEGSARVGAVVLNPRAYSDEESLWYEASKRALLQGQRDGDLLKGKRRRALDDLLAERSIHPVFQPIVSLQSQSVFGYEALTRLKDNRVFPGPLELFQCAGEEGKLYSLERIAREKSIEACDALGTDQKLFINVMAQIMEDPGFSPGRTARLLEQHQLSPEQIVFEITERSAIEDYPAVKRALQHYRNQGYQIAIDDVGAGYSSLQSIVELRPDYLKVDRSIISNIHGDDVKKHILHTLQEVGAKLQVSLIAEGIELEEELSVLKAMGVQYAQGYLLGRPGPLPRS
ncbi:EAL domain-containing protein [Paenibacillus sp. PL2-23]|uniref:EAL domain-containing protein n=1 Tax=Paenibacillus sp. PL2-23 TaxID=2100729 RepID=UPI0030F88F51